MSHAGTMDLGRSAQTKQSGSPWLAVALILVVAVAAIGAVWFASSAGLVGGTTKPESVTYVNRYGPPALPNDLSVRRGYAIGAQPTVIALPNDLSVRRGYAIGAQPTVIALPNDLSVRRGYAVGAQPTVIALPNDLSVRRGYALEDAASFDQVSVTSGTFHIGR
jgi:hypothetical protein